MTRVRNIAFCLLMAAALYANTAPVSAMGGDCITSQPFCYSVLEIAASSDCGGSYNVDSFCEGCGWDNDHCCMTWTCMG